MDGGCFVLVTVSNGRHVHTSALESDILTSAEDPTHFMDADVQWERDRRHTSAYDGRSL